MKKSFFSTILISFLFFGLIYSQAPIDISDPTDLIGQKVPDFIGITLTGVSITNNDFVGKITLMQFMYFPCRPCLLEVPYFNNLSHKYSEKDLEIIAVIPNTPRDIMSYQLANDTASVFSRYRVRSKYDSIHYTILPECNENIEVKPNRIGVDCNKISRVFMRDFYPTSYLIDKEGIIRKVFIGFDTSEKDSEIKKIEDAVLELLK